MDQHMTVLTFVLWVSKSKIVCFRLLWWAWIMVVGADLVQKGSFNMGCTD